MVGEEGCTFICKKSAFFGKNSAVTQRFYSSVLVFVRYKVVVNENVSFIIDHASGI